MVEAVGNRRASPAAPADARCRRRCARATAVARAVGRIADMPVAGAGANRPRRRARAAPPRRGTPPRRAASGRYCRGRRTGPRRVMRHPALLPKRAALLARCKQKHNREGRMATDRRASRAAPPPSRASAPMPGTPCSSWCSSTSSISSTGRSSRSSPRTSSATSASRRRPDRLPLRHRLRRLLRPVRHPARAARRQLVSRPADGDGAGALVVDDRACPASPTASACSPSPGSASASARRAPRPPLIR